MAELEGSAAALASSSLVPAERSQGMQQAPCALQLQLRQQEQEPGEQKEQGGLLLLPPLPPGSPPAVLIIRHSCDLLALPTRVVCTALTFSHRMDPEEVPPEVRPWQMPSACAAKGARRVLPAVCSDTACHPQLCAMPCCQLTSVAPCLWLEPVHRRPKVMQGPPAMPACSAWRQHASSWPQRLRRRRSAPTTC